MVREPTTPPSPSPDPAPGSNAWPRWMFFAGGALLIAGIGLIVVAVAVTSSDQIDDVGFSLAADRAGTPVNATPTAVGTISPSPKPNRTKRPSAAKSPTPKAEPTRSATPSTAPKKKVRPIRPKVGTGYRLYNVATRKCLGTQALNVTSTQELCSAAARIRLVASRVDAGVQLYQVHETGAGDLCLDPPGRGTNASGTQISSVPCLVPSTEDNQEWQLRDVGEVAKGRAVYALVNRASGLCLDVLGSVPDGSDRPAGLPVTLATCTDGGYDDRLWIFY